MKYKGHTITINKWKGSYVASVDDVLRVEETTSKEDAIDAAKEWIDDNFGYADKLDKNLRT